MPAGVKCQVEECVYNKETKCVADAIEVTSNGNAIVGTNKGSMCATFEYRDHYRADAGLSKEEYRERYDGNSPSH
ncbi:DUF1540 domain-containing protein [Tumebacillus flagellatus]|uniref:DUF1540 domain-containing protein n=1 Tax=Tumebacillus flagellatus TaxID=1157490 RepID=A0A074LMM8_9BACL|nr:DUF1540 domain-containing protein [Tumebacillus flagellatus]KEO82394.1 hypothetical protein EL26_15840 [Tumebacillus flagellatus]